MKPGNGKRGILILAMFATSLAGASSLIAQSADVFTWTDENGVVHFSDSPPGEGRADQISVPGVYRPGTSDAYSIGEEGEPSEDVPEAVEAPKSAAQLRREQIAKTREEKQKAEADARRFCGRHRQRLTQMEPARRVFYTDARGEQVRMDDDQRMQLIEESRQYLARYCD